MTPVKNIVPVLARLDRRHEAKEKISGDRFSYIIFISCILAVMVQISLILVSWGKLPPQIPLFYSRPWGEAMLASPIFLWILPITSSAFFIINFLVVIILKREEMFLSRILTSFSLICCLALLYDTAKIISLLT